MLFFSIFNTSNHKNIPTIKKLNAKIFSTQLQWAVITIAKLHFFFKIRTGSLFSPFSLLFPLSLLSSLSHAFVCSWWSADDCGPAGWFDFVGLRFMVWFHGFGLCVLILVGWFDFVTRWVHGSLIGVGIGVQGRSARLGVWRGSLSWLAWVFDRCGGCWNCGGWWLVANSG